MLPQLGSGTGPLSVSNEVDRHEGGWSSVDFGIFWAEGEIAGSIFSAHKVKSVKA